MEIDTTKPAKDFIVGAVWKNRNVINVDKLYISNEEIESGTVSGNTHTSKGINSEIKLNWKLISAPPTFWTAIWLPIFGKKEFYKYLNIEKLTLNDNTHSTFTGDN